MAFDRTLPDIGEIPEKFFDGAQRITDRVLARLLNAMGNHTRSKHENIVTASVSAGAPGQQASVIVNNALMVLAFTPNTDSAFRQFKIPYNFVGNPQCHIHWTKTSDADESGKAVRWRLSYHTFASSLSTTGVGNTAPATIEFEDTYDASDTTERRVYRTADLDLEGITAGEYLALKIEAITPTGTAMASEPGLFSLDFTFDEYINK